MRIGKLALALSLTCCLMASAPAQADVVYSVRQGDTLERISGKYDVDSDQIVKANPKVKFNTTLKEGLVIVIPDKNTKNVASEKDNNDVLAGLDSNPPKPKVIKMDASNINRSGDRHRNRLLASRGGAMANSLVTDAHKYMGTPYVMGATGNGAFDCSGFTMRMFQKYGVNIPRTADVQYNVGVRVPRGEECVGDLVFFETYLPGPSHVGIYVGNGDFIHASSSRGVTISNLRQPYYSSRYLGAKRVL